MRVHNPYLSIEEGQKRIVAAGFYPRYAQGGWEFIPENFRVPIRTALRNEFFENIHTEPRGFFIHGGIGVGKSMLLGLMAQSIVRQFQANIKFASATILEDLFFGVRDTNKKQQLEALKTCDALFLDDLGAEYGSEFSMTGFTNIIEYRYAHFKPTYITSNYAVHELAEIEGYGRIASRLNQNNWMLHLHYKGADKRLRD